MKAFVLGTAGHVDHGKTTLVRALTGVDTDRWREEKERGLTIDLGFAELDLSEEFEIGVIDVPGHEDFVKNMLAGSTGLDLLLLVVAADEGVMPQTREHLVIAGLLGIREGIVVLTRIDRADDELADLAEETVRDELRITLGHVDWPILRVCAPTGQGLDALREAILARAARVRVRDAADVLRLPVDRSFSLAGAGTVVTGTLWSGAVSVGDTVRVLPIDLTARVRSAQVHGQSRDRVEPGRRCALALVGVDGHDVPRGSTVVAGDEWRLVKRLAARIDLASTSSRSLKHGQRVRMFLGTTEVMVRIVLPRDEEMRPGESEWAVVECEVPVVCRARDRFVLRFYSPVTTIGGGVVAELDPPLEWWGRAHEWESLVTGEPLEAIEAAARLSTLAGIPQADLPQVTGISAGRIETALTDSPRQIIYLVDRWFPRHALKDVEQGVIDSLTRAHAADRRAGAISLESLRNSVAEDRHGRVAPGLLEHVIRELAGGGAIEVDGPRVRLPGHEPQLTHHESRLLGSLLETISEGGLQPPSLSELDGLVGGDKALRADLLRILMDRGEVVAITPDLVVCATAATGLADLARKVLEREEPASPAAFRTVLGVSRKYLIPLLEFLDRTGVTRRTPTGRVRAG